MSYRHVFAGRNGTIYALHDEGNLHWFRHTDFAGGTSSWSGGGAPRALGSGWNQLYAAMGSNNGVIYTIDGEGKLRWFQHLGHEDGSDRWANNGNGLVIGEGWLDFTFVAAGDDGVLYAQDAAGDLRWYKHTGHATGARSWQNEAGSKVGSGWQSVDWFGVSSGGVIYARTRSDGNLLFYKHLGYQDGSGSWAPSPQVGEGWGDLWRIAATNGRVLYTVSLDGSVSFYRNDVEATKTWTIRTGIGGGLGPALPPSGLQPGTYTLKARSNGKYLCREAGHYVANRDAADAWEKFKLKRSGAGWTIQDYKDDYLTLALGHINLEPFGVHHTRGVQPSSTDRGKRSQWQLPQVGSGSDYALDQEGFYVTAEPSGVIAFDRTVRQDWETFTLTRV